MVRFKTLAAVEAVVTGGALSLVLLVLQTKYVTHERAALLVSWQL